MGKSEADPQVNKSIVITPSIGQVWKETCDSKRTPAQLTPMGTILWQWYDRSVRPHSLIKSNMAFASLSSEFKNAESTFSIS